MGPIEELIEAAGAVVDAASNAADDALATQRMHRLRVARQRAHHDQFRTEHELMELVNRRGQLMSLYGQRIDVLWGALDEVSGLCARWTKQADARENPMSSLLIMSMVSEAVAVLNRVEGDNHTWDVRDALGGPPVVRDNDNERLLDLQRELLALEATDPVVGAAAEQLRMASDHVKVAASYVQRIERLEQRLEQANADLTEQLAASEADRMAMTYTVKPCARCKELESECDLLIWENEQCTREVMRVTSQHPLVMKSVTDAQRAEIQRQLDGAPSQFIPLDDSALADLRKRNLQALDALHAERREKKLAADELDRVRVIVGKLRTNHAWVSGVLDALANGNRMDAAPIIQGSRGQVDMLSNQERCSARWHRWRMRRLHSLHWVRTMKQVDATLLVHAHNAFIQLAKHFSDQGLPTDVLLTLTALIVVAEADGCTLDAVLADVRSLALDLTDTHVRFPPGWRELS